MGDSLSAPRVRSILVVSDLISSDLDGGREVVAYPLAKHLQTRGHRVRLFVGRMASAGQAGRLDVEEADGLRVWRMSVVSLDPTEALWPPIGARLRCVLEAEQPDLVQFHNFGAPGLSLIPLVKRRRLPTLVTLDEGDCYWATGLHADANSRREPAEGAVNEWGTNQPREVRLSLPIRLRRDYVAWALAHADQLLAPSAAIALKYTAAGVADQARLKVISKGETLSRSADEGTARAMEILYEEVLRAPRLPSLDRPIVLCAGDRAVPQAAAVCNDLYLLEEQRPGIRLIWHEWADPDVWLRATLLWNWSSGANLVVIQRALRAGVPVLAPTSCATVAAIESSFGAALTYGTVVEGMVALARLPHDTAALHELRRNCREAATLLAASAPPETYNLPAPPLSS